MVRQYLKAAVLTSAFVLGSCRSVTAPLSLPAGQAETLQLATHAGDDAARGARRSSALGDHSDDPASRQVPIVRQLEVVADERGVHFRMYLHAERSWFRPFYGPHTPGGWQFQTFLNVDQDPATGYCGYEFLTRDSESGPGTLILRRTEGGGGPGGWGPEVVRIPVRVTSRFLSFTVPLDAIGDDGSVNFSIELYATVLGGDDGQTPVANLVRLYTGSSRVRGPSLGTDIVATLN